jgi:hypothetical protein
MSTPRFNFLEGKVRLRDLGAVLEHEKPLPIRWKIASSSYWLLLARGPAIFGCPSEPRTHGRWNCANNTKT